MPNDNRVPSPSAPNMNGPDDAAPDERPPTPDRRLREEREADVLLRLAARHAMPSLDPADPANAPYFEWLARETRERQNPDERHAVRAAAIAFAERMRSGRATSRSAVVAVDEAPVLFPSPFSGSLAQVIGAAARARSAPVIDLAVAAGIGRDLWEEPSTECVQLPDGIPDGEFVALRVAGESMLPLLHADDVMLVRLGSEVHLGAIVVARHPDDGYVVKRVGMLRPHEVELHSLNPRYAPITIPRDDALVLGTVLLRWCTHGDSKGRRGAQS
jgi:SOS-response transcriptional repressor LexA